MKIQDMLRQANLKCEDNVNGNTLLLYLNQGINRLNLECNLQLPEVLQIDTAGEYQVSEDDFVNRIVCNILISYIAFCIRQNEGYLLNENVFYTEYVATKMQFATKFSHLILDEYKISLQQNGSVIRASTPKIIKNKIKLW